MFKNDDIFVVPSFLAYVGAVALTYGWVGNLGGFCGTPALGKTRDCLAWLWIMAACTAIALVRAFQPNGKWQPAVRFFLCGVIPFIIPLTTRLL